MTEEMKDSLNIEVEISKNYHTKLHKNEVEHELDGDTLEVTVDYTLQKASKLFLIDFDHKPLLDCNGEYEVFEILNDIEKPFGTNNVEDRTYFVTKRLTVLGWILEKVLENKRTIVDLDEFVDLILKNREVMNEWESEIKRRKEVKREKEEKEREERIRQKKEDERKRKEEKEKEEAFINDFVKNRASDRIRKCVERGYKCRKAIVKEMARAYLGKNWALDYDEVVTTKDRSCPSNEAINMEIEIDKNWDVPFLTDISVKWLPNAFSQINEDGMKYFHDEGMEAIEVKFLNEYFYLPIEG